MKASAFRKDTDTDTATYPSENQPKADSSFEEKRDPS